MTRTYIDYYNLKSYYTYKFNEKEAYWDEEISNLEKANEETEKAIELARLQEALANAKKEKTKRVWKENIGWVNFLPCIVVI